MIPDDLLPWGVIAVVVGGMLALDLLVPHRDAKPVPFREAVVWSVVWVSLALAFVAFVVFTRGSTAGGEYLAGYLIELSLSVDNVFVFSLLFAAFAVPAAYQHRLLFWGILGAIVFRAVFIVAGTAALEAAHWVIYLLGGLPRGHRHPPGPIVRSRGRAGKNPVLRLFRRVVPMTDDYRGAAFIVLERGRHLATPLLAVLVAVETTDFMFALDGTRPHRVRRRHGPRRRRLLRGRSRRAATARPGACRWPSWPCSSDRSSRLCRASSLSRPTCPFAGRGPGCGSASRRSSSRSVSLPW